MRSNLYTEEECEKIKRLAPLLSDQELASRLRRPVGSIAAKRIQLGIRKGVPQKPFPRDVVLEILNLRSKGLSLSQVAKKVGRTRGSITSKMSRLYQIGVSDVESFLRYDDIQRRGQAGAGRDGAGSAV